jgi:ABC-type uncharacterized transport system ATPase subunit
MRPVIESIEPRLLMSVTLVLSTAQKQDLAALAEELQVIHAGSSVTTAEVQAVATDFASIAKVAHAPSQASVQKLVTDTKSALADGKITPKEEAELIADVQAVVASTGVPTSLAQQTAADLKAIVTGSNITTTEAKAVFSDLTAFLSGFKS